MTQPSTSGPARAQRSVRTSTVSHESNLPLIDCIADHQRTLCRR
jgi:hypothetical protein